MKPLTNVLVVGVDGAEPTIFESLASKGEMPNFARLRARGICGRTQNPKGLEAGAVWPTFHSGQYPGQQPQFDGARLFDSSNYSSRWYELDEVSPHIWKRLSDQGKRVLVMDAPYVRLDPSLNGAMILDWGSHVASNGHTMELQTHPASLIDEVLELVGPDPTGGRMCDGCKLETVADYQDFIGKYMDRIEKKGRLSVHMLQKGDWDYAEIVFTDLHSMGHHTWHINDVHHPEYRSELEKGLGEPLLDAYRAFDKALGQILDTVDERTQVVFFISHGMGPQYTGTGLLDRILARFEQGEGGGGVAPREANPLKSQALRAWKSVPPGIRANLKPLRKPFAGALTVKRFLPDPETRRYFEVYANNAAGGVRINLQGREKNGIVPQDEYFPLLEEIRDKLMTFTKVGSGEPFIDECIITQQVYDGEHVNQLPDLLVCWNRDSAIEKVESPLTGVLEQRYGGNRTGDHTLQGMFIAAGPGVQPAVLNNDVAAVDFVPTLAAMLGVDAGPTDGTPIAAFGLQ